MGRARQKRERFRVENPNCCFCGGSAAFETVDHIPGRAMFLGRQAPEGMEFPSCFACNNGTRGLEELAAFVALCSPHAGEELIKQSAPLRASLIRRYPERMRALLPSSREKRQLIADTKLEIPDGLFLQDVPIVKLEKDFWEPALMTFGVKLGCALHYKHTSRIIPPNGRVGVRLCTNINFASDEAVRDLLELAPSLVMGNRANVDMGGQFAYRMSLMENGDGGLFIVSIQKMLFYSIVTLCNPDLVDAGDSDIFLPPLNHG